jgi:dihydropteroate synthase
MNPPLIMGIVNVTPDSFFDGGRHASPEAAIAHGRRLLEEGADILDVGGESTRPGAQIVPADTEQQRILPIIRALMPIAKDHGVLISVDTRNASTMQKAVEAGAGMVNDVSALSHDPESLRVVAERPCRIVLMHMAGTPGSMQNDPRYGDVVGEVKTFLHKRVEIAVAAGVDRDRLILDPGIGFGKTEGHNLALLKGLPALNQIGCPVLIGVSRKGFIGRLSRNEPAADRLPGSLALALHAAIHGAAILRVHDVAATFQALALWSAVEAG